MCNPVTNYGFAATTGATVFSFSVPSAAYPVLQAQDGTFYGTDDNGNMIRMTGSGQTMWSVPNDYPQIATADGGVIGSSGTTYDSQGRATGQVGSLPTYSWKGVYTDGPVQSLAVPIPTVAPVFGALAGGGPTGGGTAVAVHSFGLFWCGNSLSGTCQHSPLSDSDLGFSYAPTPINTSLLAGNDFTCLIKIVKG